MKTIKVIKERFKLEIFTIAGSEIKRIATEKQAREALRLRGIPEA